jgi:hypothetical protein
MALRLNIVDNALLISQCTEEGAISIAPLETRISSALSGSIATTANEADASITTRWRKNIQTYYGLVLVALSAESFAVGVVRRPWSPGALLDVSPDHAPDNL